MELILIVVFWCCCLAAGILGSPVEVIGRT